MIILVAPVIFSLTSPNQFYNRDMTGKLYGLCTIDFDIRNIAIVGGLKNNYLISGLQHRSKCCINRVSAPGVMVISVSVNNFLI